MKTQFSFTNLSNGNETFLSAPNPALARLAGAVIHRIENPDGAKLQGKTPLAKSATFGKRKVGKSPYRTGAARIRQFSREDRQDALQEVLATVAQMPPDAAWDCPFRHTLTLPPETVFQCFRNVRGLLRMNGGNHDRALCDSLDLLTEKGRDFAAPHRSDEDHEVTATAREVWEEKAREAYAADTSRKREANFREAMSLIAFCAGESTGHIFTSPSQRRMKMLRLRSYLSIPCKGARKRENASKAESLAREMTALF